MEYKSKLSVRETERAIRILRDEFERGLSAALNLERISAPVLLKAGNGLNDDLSGIEKPVSFFVKNCGLNVEVVQSLAKWKRVALKKYGFSASEGMYTDMNALRPDDVTDFIHSVYVDQWDWERVITRDERSVEFLKSIVQKIADAIVSTSNEVKRQFKNLSCNLEREVFFITGEELLQRYPTLTSKEREKRIVTEKKTVFIMQIGNKLSNGEPHDTRSPDYDDFSLNGDLLFYHEGLDLALEISSMGIRVDAETLKKQLTLLNKQERLKYEYHQDIINDRLPLTIGGGIGQSRLCMLILEKNHIGEVQASVWSDEEVERCEKMGIRLL